MTDAADQLPYDLASAHAMILGERAARREAEALATGAQAVNSHSDAPIARLRLELKKLKRDIHGSRSERKARLLEQMELQLEELETDASEDELAAEMAARSSAVRAYPAPVEGDPDRAREVHLPRMRENHPILFEKFAQHQPLNRQSERYAREGIDLSLSTDQ